MEVANCPSENATARPRVVFRERHQDDDAPPFFVHFERDGKALTLLTPATREDYFAAPLPVG